ncbi:MAG: antibiotic biosynthesis monooxygenase [Acidimicrobiia bacterium]|nr:antibiotic biosynthesis monooxygenase [Acidimicrobiia bacterium]
MSRTVTLAKLPLKPGTRDEFIAAFGSMFPVVAGEDGTVIYALHTDDKDPDLVWIYELYADEAALATHMASDGFATAFAAFGGFVAEGAELIRMTPVQAEGFEI